jgi:hypothetical protein
MKTVPIRAISLIGAQSVMLVKITISLREEQDLLEILDLELFGVQIIISIFFY